MKTRSFLILLGIVVLLGAPFVVPLFNPWSRINCREQEIDVLSGLRRDARYIYWLPLRRNITGTTLSDAISVGSLKTTAPRWESVNTFGPYTRHSPHYRYHAAFNQIQQLQLIWDELGFGTEKRRNSAQTMLREWQTTGSDSSADGYLQDQMAIAQQDGTQTTQRIELLEQRLEILIDQNARNQARRKAEAQGFEVHEIEKK